MAANAIEVFACEPEWAALVLEIAGNHANITTATTATQDPHRLQAKPSLIAATRRADLLVCTGADLEIGWLPLLLRRAGNPDIQPGQSGYFLAADYVRKLEIPKMIDRSQGDIHPQGNPHIHLNPRNVSRIAERLAERLQTLDPANSSDYTDRLKGFQDRWEDSIDEWERRGERLEGLRLASHHRSFSYLANWLDLEVVATARTETPGFHRAQRTSRDSSKNSRRTHLPQSSEHPMPTKNPRPGYPNDSVRRHYYCPIPSTNLGVRSTCSS